MNLSGIANALQLFDDTADETIASCHATQAGALNT